MFTNGINTHPTIAKLEKARKAIIEELLEQPVLSIVDYRRYMSRYHHIGVKLHREKQARGLAPTLETPGSTHILSTVNNQTPYNF